MWKRLLNGYLSIVVLLAVTPAYIWSMEAAEKMTLLSLTHKDYGSQSCSAPIPDRQFVYLTKLSSPDMWRKIMEYLPGNNAFLNTAMRIIKPTDRLATVILKKKFPKALSKNVQRTKAILY